MDRYYIKKSDVGKTARSGIRSKCSHCEHVRNEYPFAPLGWVLEADIGKMCVKRKNKDGESIWYVENTEQFKKRKAHLLNLLKIHEIEKMDQMGKA